MARDKIAVAVNNLSAVVDSSAEARSLTHVEHCAAEVLHMISKDRVVGVVADSTKAGRKSGNEIVVTVGEVAAPQILVAVDVSVGDLLMNRIVFLLMIIRGRSSCGIVHSSSSFPVVQV